MTCVALLMCIAYSMRMCMASVICAICMCTSFMLFIMFAMCTCDACDTCVILQEFDKDSNGVLDKAEFMALTSK